MRFDLHRSDIARRRNRYSSACSACGRCSRLRTLSSALSLPASLLRSGGQPVVIAPLWPFRPGVTTVPPALTSGQAAFKQHAWRREPLLARQSSPIGVLLNMSFAAHFCSVRAVFGASHGLGRTTFRVSQRAERYVCCRCAAAYHHFCVPWRTARARSGRARRCERPKLSCDSDGFWQGRA